MASKISNILETLTLEDDEEPIDSSSRNPNKAWKKMKCVKNPVKCLDLKTPIQDDKIRIVCISDTHNLTRQMWHPIPKGHILIHAGDFTMHGHLDEVEEFCQFLSQLPKEQIKIVIAGNHDVCLDAKYQRKSHNLEAARKLLSKHCIYLEDSSVNACGLKIYGSPWQPRHCNNGFQLERGKELLAKWKKIPNDTDILVTHGPPIGYGDNIDHYDDYHVGCVDLLREVKERVKPKYHIFGHIHEDHGMWTNNLTTFINASICASHYKPVNEPILIDVDFAPNFSKEHLPSI